MSRGPTGRGDRTKSGTCNNCGQAGHWKCDCPKLARGGGGGGRGRGGSRGRNFELRGRNSGQQQRKPFTKGPSSWKTTPPGPRDPKEKMVADRKFFWCDKCTRWSTSHSTATHVAKAPGAHVAPCRSHRQPGPNVRKLLLVRSHCGSEALGSHDNVDGAKGLDDQSKPQGGRQGEPTSGQGRPPADVQGVPHRSPDTQGTP